MIGTTQERFCVSDHSMHPRQHQRCILRGDRFPFVCIIFPKKTIRRVPIHTNGRAFQCCILREGFDCCGIQSVNCNHYSESTMFPRFPTDTITLVLLSTPRPCFPMAEPQKKCIIHLDHTFKHIYGVTVIERRPDLVDREPGGYIIDFKISFRQGGRTPPLVRSNHLYGPKSLAKREMGTVEHRFYGQRGVEPIVFALKYFPLLRKVCFGISTLRTLKTIFQSYYLGIQSAVLLYIRKITSLCIFNRYPH